MVSADDVILVGNEITVLPNGSDTIVVAESPDPLSVSLGSYGQIANSDYVVLLGSYYVDLFEIGAD